MEKKLKIGIIGCGYWGPNLVRNFSALSNCVVSCVADKKEGRLEFIKKEFPFVSVTSDYRDIISSEDIDAVCIATPVKTHSQIAIEALDSGKHVFIEKPMASSIEEAEAIIESSRRNNKKVAVGHVFLFAPGVRAIKKLIDSRAIGKVFHISSTRINLGPPETDINVIWDLGPHDFSILLFLMGEYPKEVLSRSNYFPFGFSVNDKNKLVNNANLFFSFPSGATANVHLSWLSSNKVRLMQIFGSEGTIVYDEMLALDGKVKLYGKGIDNRINANGSDNMKLGYSTGDIHIIQLEQHEPLRMECQHFVDSVLNLSLIHI
ncbi:MAG: Gfo/Idh/MocA family oxidoreductase, partial [Ignavibacteria bacterium]|nr:Gfo/Idh/MocA family oxidoreductase [Ignavibacteria bacterium]